MKTLILPNKKKVDISNYKYFYELISEFENYYSGIIVAAISTNEMFEITKEIPDCEIKLLDTSTIYGIRIYIRGITHLFLTAFSKLYDNNAPIIKHGLSYGLYIEAENKEKFTQFEVDKIKEEMQNLIKRNIEIEKKQYSKEEVIKYYKEIGYIHKAELLENSDINNVILYDLDGYKNYFYGVMVSSTKYLKEFDLMSYSKGLLLRYPTTSSKKSVPAYIPQNNLAKVFLEFENWAKILDVDYITKVNKAIKDNKASNIILTAEELYSKRVTEVADDILKKNKKIVLIAGPSSSGKTTTANRLSTCLKVNGLNPRIISVDNYFVERKDNPLDENGNYDFECVEAIDLKLLNDHLEKLIKGEEVELPEFDFHEGKKKYNGKKLKIGNNDVLILEGIHCLNDLLTSQIDKSLKYKIYVSCLTQLNIDEQNRIPTTDTRLLRRIVRDAEHRGYTASDTIKMWPIVRKGEEKYIFPFQDTADSTINTALVYDLHILKKHAEPILQEVPKNSQERITADGLLNILRYICSIEDNYLVPNISIMREFIGGSVYR